MLTLEQMEMIERALTEGELALTPLRRDALNVIRSSIWTATRALRDSDKELIPIAEALGKIKVAATYVPQVESRIKPRPLEGVANGSDLLAKLGLTREVYAETETETSEGED